LILEFTTHKSQSQACTVRLHVCKQQGPAKHQVWLMSHDVASNLLSSLFSHTLSILFGSVQAISFRSYSP